MLYQRRGGAFDNDVVDGDFEIGIERLNTFAHLRGTVHVDVNGEEEVRYRADRRNETIGDGLPYMSCWFVAITRGSSCGSRCCFEVAYCLYYASYDAASALSTALTVSVSHS